jgi:hypothetical protein
MRGTSHVTAGPCVGRDRVRRHDVWPARHFFLRAPLLHPPQQLSGRASPCAPRRPLAACCRCSCHGPAAGQPPGSAAGPSLGFAVDPRSRERAPHVFPSSTTTTHTQPTTQPQLIHHVHRLQGPGPHVRVLVCRTAAPLPDTALLTAAPALRASCPPTTSASTTTTSARPTSRARRTRTPPSTPRTRRALP